MNYVDGILVTPEMAEAWLRKRDSRQRNVSETNVQKIVKSMVKHFDEGRVYHCPNPIQINSDGQLQDGQHRLTAVSRAAALRPGIKVPMAVIFDAPKEMFENTDVNKARSLGSFCKFDVPDTEKLMALGATCYRLSRDGVANLRNLRVTKGDVGSNADSDVVNKYLEDNYDIVDMFVENRGTAARATTNNVFPTTQPGLLLAGAIVMKRDRALGAQWWDDVESIIDMDVSAMEAGNALLVFGGGTKKNGDKATKKPKSATSMVNLVRAVFIASKYRDGELISNQIKENSAAYQKFEVEVW